MTNGARLILQGAQPAIQAAAPVSNLLSGTSGALGLQGAGLRNQLLGQQIQAAPLQRELMAAQVAAAPAQLEAQQLQNQLRQAQIDALGVPDAPTAQQVALNAAKIKGLKTVEQKLSAIDRMRSEAIAANRTTSNLDELKAAFEQDEALGNELLDAGISAFRQSGFLKPEEEAAATSASQREFESLIAGFTPEEQTRARRIKAGLEPRAVGTGAITAATTEGLTEAVAKSEATIKQRTKFAEMTGASRAKAIDSGFDRIQKINTNIANIDRAIQAIDDGASTGAIESRFFPTFRRATKELEQVQKELGLDVIGSVTFGALSEGELDLALQTALPTGLEPEALREFLTNKREAQQKLRSYYQEQVDFLDQGGTIAGFLRSRERGAAAQQSVQTGLTDRQRRLEELRSRVNL